MSRKSKEVVIEKDVDGEKVRAVATDVTFKGLIADGWTVVDDGDKEDKKAAEEEAKAAQQLEDQEHQLFGSPDEE